jgi:hypothetical protein
MLSSPPAGFILLHNHVKHGAMTRQSTNGFRAWFSLPSAEHVVCDCGWRPELGKHYRIDRQALSLVHPSVLVAHEPSRFEHNPGVGMRRVGLAALRYLHAVNEHENVAVFIPVNLASRSSFVTHGSVLDSFAFPDI